LVRSVEGDRAPPGPSPGRGLPPGFSPGSAGSCAGAAGSLLDSELVATWKGSLKYWATACLTGLLCATIHITMKKAIIAVTKSA